ncbi:STAS domain-containing protein [Symbioplanes lichenis]|uniref:STAS domain-containing protein n=1 Tax=Symbioplanes lichenis TaxID=1629072 RepID=UPI00273A2043|nr:STAS domain-containing protein [Actinoplanes lichenis]
MRKPMYPPPSWSSRVEHADGVRTVSLTGDIDLTGADEVRRLLVAELDEPGTDTVVADLGGVPFLDSAGLGALIGAFNHAQDHGLRFRIQGSQHAARRIMEVAGVYALLTGA